MSIPRIMYDQSQFTPIYFIEPDSIWINDFIYRESRKLSGYAPHKWYCYTQSKPNSFWFGAYDEEALAKEAEWGFKNFTDPTFFRTLEETVPASIEKARKVKNLFFTHVYKDGKVMLQENPQKTLEVLQEAKALSEFLMPYYVLTQPQRFQKFEEVLKSHQDDSFLQEVSQTGRKLTLISQTRLAILEYVKALQENQLSASEKQAQMQKVVSELGFLNYGLLGGEMIDQEYVEKEVKKLLSDKAAFDTEYAQISKLTQQIQKRERLLQENDSEAYRLADIMGHISVIRFDLQTCVLASLRYVDEIIRAANTAYSVSKEDTDAYLYSEICELIANGKKPDQSIIETRKKGMLRIFAEDAQEMYFAEEAQNKIKDLLEWRRQEIESTKSLKGTVASRPKGQPASLKGKVFVLTTAFGADEVIKEMRPGEILVATQTHPNIVPKMKEALAILTDEGGVTCHAAIVSRELGKPCIIGAKLATKIFKTGDMIEMNFDTGTVIKIS